MSMPPGSCSWEGYSPLLALCIAYSRAIRALVPPLYQAHAAPSVRCTAPHDWLRAQGNPTWLHGSNLKNGTPTHHFLPSAPGETKTEKPNPLHKAKGTFFNFGKRSISQTIMPGCQGTIYVTTDLCLLLVPVSIFTTAHGHYRLESFYWFVQAVAKFFEISHMNF